MEYFTCVTNIPLTSLYRKIKPEELYMLYEAYHSLDNDLVVQRICEAKGIHLNLNDVELLKKYIIKILKDFYFKINDSFIDLID